MNISGRGAQDMNLPDIWPAGYPAFIFARYRISGGWPYVCFGQIPDILPDIDP